MARYTHRPVVYRLGELLLGTPRVRSRKNSQAKSHDGALASPLGVADGLADADLAAGSASVERTEVARRAEAASGEKGGEAPPPPSPNVDTTDVPTTTVSFAGEPAADVFAGEPVPEAAVSPKSEAVPEDQRSSAVHRSYFDLLEEKYTEPAAPKPAREGRGSIFGSRSPARAVSPAPQSLVAASAPVAIPTAPAAMPAARADAVAPRVAVGAEAAPFQGKHLPKEVVDRQVASSQRRDRRRRWLYPLLAALTMSAGIYASFRLNAPSEAPAPSAEAPALPSAASSVEELIGRSTEPEHVRVPAPRDSGAPSRSVDLPPKASTSKPKSVPKASTPARKPAAEPKAADAKPATRPRANGGVAPRGTEPTLSTPIQPAAPILAPVRKFSPQPDYPTEARAAGLEGSVTLYGLIGEDGAVRDARVLRGLSPALDQAALAAFSTWRYEPARQDGAPVEQKLNVNIQFRLDAFTPTPRVPLPLEVGGDVSPPTRITMVWPTTPQSAQLVHGEVMLQLVVDEIGNVTSVNVLKGLPHGLTEAAIEAVRQWKFRPARRNGLPVAVFHQVSLRF
jgi:TonB family protein